MLVVYTSPGCASCRKAKAWLKENNVEFIEKNLFTTMLNEGEVRYLLSRTENGVDDIVSRRSKVLKDSGIELEDMSVGELIGFVRANPSVLKRPIMINEKNMVVGYDEDEIESFSVRDLNSRMVHDCDPADCPAYEKCPQMADKGSGK